MVDITKEGQIGWGVARGPKKVDLFPIFGQQKSLVPPLVGAARIN
jgi:hypothetical protein